MERFRAEVELASLLKGEIRVIRMEIVRPHFRVDLARLSGESTDAAGTGWRLDPERISLTQLDVAEGTAEIVDSRAGRSWRAQEIKANVEAASLRGPAASTQRFCWTTYRSRSGSDWGALAPPMTSRPRCRDLVAHASHLVG
jgi:hypothetical protein